MKKYTLLPELTLIEGGFVMGWIIFFICSIAAFLISQACKEWGRLWYAGPIAIIANYAIDSVLIRLGAFSYRYPNPMIGRLPTFYLLASFFGGIVLVKYYPEKSAWKLPYIILSSFAFLLLELIMHSLDYFNYHNWSPINSFFLDFLGFTVVIWLWSWINEIRKAGD